LRIRKRFLRNLRNLKGATLEIGGDGGLEPRADLLLGIGGLRSKIPAGVAKALADRVDTNKGTRIQEVLARDITGSHRVNLGPLGVRVVGEKLRSGKLVLGVAVRRLLRVGEGHGAGAQILEALGGLVRLHGRDSLVGCGSIVRVALDKGFIGRAVVVSTGRFSINRHGCTVAAGHHRTWHIAHVHAAIVAKSLRLATEEAKKGRVYNVKYADQDCNEEDGQEDIPGSQHIFIYLRCQDFFLDVRLR